MTEWGEPIAVNGKRPEWLDTDAYQVTGRSGDWSEGPISSAWPLVKSIRLPANHPHYRTEATMVDWTQPIEAVHEDGRVVAVTHDIDNDGDHRLRPCFTDNIGRSANWANDDGSVIGWTDWTIRNTPQSPSQPRTAPSQENGSGEAFERMKALCEAVADCIRGNGPHIDSLIERARAIMALLAPDPDEAEAERLAGDGPCNRVEVILAAIKRGRQLERGGD